jgi:hypothetical protein
MSVEFRARAAKKIVFVVSIGSTKKCGQGFHLSAAGGFSPTSCCTCRSAPRPAGEQQAVRPPEEKTTITHVGTFGLRLLLRLLHEPGRSR